MKRKVSELQIGLCRMFRDLIRFLRSWPTTGLDVTNLCPLDRQPRSRVKSVEMDEGMSQLPESVTEC
jgi:hypothetical protein